MDHHRSLVPQDALQRFIPVWVLTKHPSEATTGQNHCWKQPQLHRSNHTELGLDTPHRPHKTMSSFSCYWLLGPAKWLQWIYEFPQVILARLILHFCTFYPAEVSSMCGNVTLLLPRHSLNSLELFDTWKIHFHIKAWKTPIPELADKRFPSPTATLGEVLYLHRCLEAAPRQRLFGNSVPRAPRSGGRSSEESPGRCAGSDPHGHHPRTHPPSGTARTDLKRGLEKKKNREKKPY